VTGRDHTKDTVLTSLRLTQMATPVEDTTAHAVLNALTFLVLRTPSDPEAGAPPERTLT
jgi:hypothetical protein